MNKLAKTSNVKSRQNAGIRSMTAAMHSKLMNSKGQHEAHNISARLRSAYNGSIKIIQSPANQTYEEPIQNKQILTPSTQLKIN